MPSPKHCTHSATFAAILAACCLAPLRGQVLILPSVAGGTVNLVNSDLAVLEAGETRKDIGCTVTPGKPVLGFDLKFHGGYDVTVPLKDLAGSDNLLTIVFRVAPANHRSEPVYFAQHIRVPAIDEDAKGDATLQGGFDLGEGNYHVDFLMRDRSERICAFSWDTEAALPAKDREIAVTLSPGAVERFDGEQFRAEPRLDRPRPNDGLSVKVLVNFAPQNALSATLQPLDTAALVSILRSIAREPRIARFSIVAFNMQSQRVLYRQEQADRIDFPSLGQAVTTVSLGKVDFSQLGQKHADTDFLADLLRKEVNGQDRPDALIFAGPKVMLDANIPPESLKELGDVDYPVFYMNYNLNPQAMPWKDAISHTVKYFRGTEYTISRPRDLWFAVSEMVGRIVKSRNERQTSSISSQ